MILLVVVVDTDCVVVGVGGGGGGGGVAVVLLELLPGRVPGGEGVGGAGAAVEGGEEGGVPVGRRGRGRRTAQLLIRRVNDLLSENKKSKFLIGTIVLSFPY